MPNRRENYKDMDKFLRTRNSQRKRYYGKTAFVFKRRRWEQDEDKLVLQSSYGDTELSSIIHRSVGAIQTRRNRLNKEARHTKES